MSTQGRWSFWLARSGDMSTIAPLTFAKKPIRSPRLTDIGRNLSGAFTCDVPFKSEAAFLSACDSTCIRAERQGAGDAIGSLKWSGFINSISTDLAAEVTSITAVGWFEELRQRKTRSIEVADGLYKYVGVVGGEIASAQVGAANAQSDTSGALDATHVRFGTATDTMERTTSFDVDQSFGDNIDSLSQIEDGYDWVVDPELRLLNTMDPADFEVHDDAHFIHGKNCVVRVVEDGTRRRNRYTVYGANGLVAVIDDPQSIVDSGGKIIDETANLSSVVDVAILEAYGNAELAANSYPPIVITIVPNSLSNSPRPYEEFEFGDGGFVTAIGGRVNLDHQPVRFFKGNFSFSPQGDEIVDELTVSF